MVKSEESSSPGWSASFLMKTTKDVAKAVASAVSSPRHSPVISSKDESDTSQIQKLQLHVSKFIKGFSSPPAVKSGPYNPEILTKQKRQWASFHLQHLGQKPLREPTRLFESLVVVGLHPSCDIQALGRQYISRKFEDSSKIRLSGQHQSQIEPSLEPQVLFVYPPEKQLPIKYKDLLSFCFPEGVEVGAVERTPSMSELNEILLGQEHLKQSDLSFVFRLQVADDSTLYGCCVLVDEVLQKPSRLISMISEKQPPSSSWRGQILTTRRCYCILSRLPFFDLHFGVLNSIFTEERLERLTRSLDVLNMEFPEAIINRECFEERSDSISPKHGDAEAMQEESIEISHSYAGDSTTESISDDVATPTDTHIEMLTVERESGLVNPEGSTYVDDFMTNKETGERCLPDAVLPLLRYHQYESSESSSSFQGSPCEIRNLRIDGDDIETEEASFSGQDDPSNHTDILEWAKENNHGSLQIICEYYRLQCPSRGSTVKFHPLEHLHPLEYRRPDETVLHTAGSTIDLRSCNTSLELAETLTALAAEEEAIALSVWAVACICGSLRLENLLTVIAGALLEKQIVFVCSNLGILSASVLSIIPLIRPYQWQSLLMPVLPNDMLEFLDAPVPYVVGVKNKTSEVQSKLTNVILVDMNKNQVKSSTIPQLPRRKELLSSLSPYHAKLVGESYLGRRRPVHECTDVQIEAAKGFLSVLRSYLDSLCSNLRSHTITNVQSNDDKVSLLLKDSFIDSFPYRDRAFMKLFVDTQLFSVHTDLVLSFFQKE